MKEYFQALLEGADDLVILNYKGRVVKDLKHSKSRFHERFPGIPDSKYFDILKKGIDTIMDVFKDNGGKYVVVNKKSNIAIQLDWRKEKFSDSKTNHGFTATTLDYLQHKNMLQYDTKIFVEQLLPDLEETLYLEDCPNYKMLVKGGQQYRTFIVIEV